MCHSLEVYKYIAVADPTTGNELVGPTSKWFAYFINPLHAKFKLRAVLLVAKLKWPFT